MSPTILRKTILAELASASPHPLPAQQLLTQVNLLVRPQLEMAQLKDQLSWLNDRFLIGYIADELDPEDGNLRRWFIKETGFAALQR